MTIGRREFPPQRGCARRTGTLGIRRRASGPPRRRFHPPCAPLSVRLVNTYMNSGRPCTRSAPCGARQSSRALRYRLQWSWRRARGLRRRQQQDLKKRYGS